MLNLRLKPVPDHPFKIYNASAGSGKTHTLTKEYLIIILSSPKNLGKILALTFTNKAVGEMKHRILDSLFQFGQTLDITAANTLFIAVMEAMEIDAETLQKRAKATLKEILHNYAFFDISTIDKFTHRLIRTFAKDLKLPQNFEVVIDNGPLLEEAVSRLILKAGTDPQLTKVLIEFALEKIADDKSWDVAIDLNKIGQLLFNENHALHLEKFKDKDIGDFMDLKKTMAHKIKVLEEKMIHEASQVLGLIEENGLEFGNFNRSSFPNFLLKIANGDKVIDFDAAWKTDFGTKPLYTKTCPEHIKVVLDGLNPQFIRAFDTLKWAFHEVSFLRNAYGNIVPLTVLNSLQLEIKALEVEKDQLSISEFNGIIAKEIKNQPAPFIYERLGEKYRHYFVDEFQDTSTMQWENLIPLIDNALVSEDALGNQGSLFLVGDAKQAIYRWRGGRAEQFLDLIFNDNNPFAVSPQVFNLGTNYRSFAEIIQFNNAFFQTTSPFMNNDLYHQMFLEGNDQLQNAQKGGYVQLTFLAGEEAATKNDLYGAEVMRTVDEIFDKGHAPSDICILVRSNKEGVALADYLTREGIPVVSSESLLLASSEKVCFLVDLLQYQNRPEDPATNYAILLYLSKKIPERHNFIANNIADLDSLLRETFGFDPLEMKQKSVYDGLELAIKHFGLADDSDAYIIFFMDAVLDLEKKEGTGLLQFLDYWEQKKGSLGLSAPTNMEAIQIMTVHKAKGLEFPIVIFPYANAHIYNRMDKKLWLPVEKESYNGFEELLLNEKKEVVQYGTLAERLYNMELHKMELDAFNVLYVALTRAVIALYVIADRQLDKNGSHNPEYYSGLFIHYLKEKGLWDTAQNKYHFGELPTSIKLAGNAPVAIPYQYTYKDRPAFRILTSSGNLWDTDREEALSKGNLLHLAMGMVHYDSDLDKVLQILSRTGTIGERELQLIRSTMHQIVAHPQLSSYFRAGTEVRNEKDIITENGRILRPDRLVMQDKKVTILDYKTGKQNPEYHHQLYAYGEALEQMDYIVDNKIIVYINETIIPEFI